MAHFFRFFSTFRSHSTLTTLFIVFVLYSLNLVLVSSLVVTTPCCHVFPHRGATFGPELPVKEESFFNYIPERPKIRSVEGPLKLTKETSLFLCRPQTVALQTYTFENSIALIPRGGCSFAEKVYYAQLLGAKAAVVFQSVDEDDPSNGSGHGGGSRMIPTTGNDDVIVMAEDSRYGNLVDIPSAFISYNSWKQIEALLDEMNSDGSTSSSSDDGGEDRSDDQFSKGEGLDDYLEVVSGVINQNGIPEGKSLLDEDGYGTGYNIGDIDANFRRLESSVSKSKSSVKSSAQASSRSLRASDEIRRNVTGFVDYETQYNEKMKNLKQLMVQTVDKDVGESEKKVVPASGSSVANFAQVENYGVDLEMMRRVGRVLESEMVYIVLNETGSLGVTAPDALPMMWDSMLFLIKVFVLIWSVMGFAYVSNWIKIRYRRLKRQHVIRSLPCKKYRKLQFHSSSKSLQSEKEAEKNKRTKAKSKYSKIANEELDLERDGCGDEGGSELVDQSQKETDGLLHNNIESDIEIEQEVTLQEYNPNIVQRQNSDLKLRSPRKNRRDGGSLNSEDSFNSNISKSFSSSCDHDLIDCDTCVICLCEFDLDDFVTVLPCKHIYHKDCIEPWLVNKSSLCPICKQSIFKNGESRSINEINETEMEQGDMNSPFSDQDEQRRGSIALTVGMILVIILSFTFILVDDDP